MRCGVYVRVYTANGEMIFGINLVFGQRERKEIGARTKRAMEEMALEKMENNLYSKEELNNYIDLIKEHFYVDGIINCPYVEGNNRVDTLILIPKTELINI